MKECVSCVGVVCTALSSHWGARPLLTPALPQTDSPSTPVAPCRGVMLISHPYSGLAVLPWLSHGTAFSLDLRCAVCIVG